VAFPHVVNVPLHYPRKIEAVLLYFVATTRSTCRLHSIGTTIDRGLYPVGGLAGLAVKLPSRWPSRIVIEPYSVIPGSTLPSPLKIPRCCLSLGICKSDRWTVEANERAVSVPK